LNQIKKIIAVAVDGPSGAGKSTVSRAAAARLGFIYADTGALYRAVGLTVLQNGCNPKNEAEVAPLLKGLSVTLRFEENGQRVLVNGTDVTEKIRTPEVSMAASAVSAIPAVRAFLLDLQRSLAKKDSVIMDGRDIGTVVLPNAEVKVFLTASPEERARRRYDELVKKGEPVIYEDVYHDMVKRDRDDSTRDIAPLKPAENAMLLDTTNLSQEEAISTLVKIITERVS